MFNISTLKDIPKTNLKCSYFLTLLKTLNNYHSKTIRAARSKLFIDLKLFSTKRFCSLLYILIPHNLKTYLGINQSVSSA